MIKRLSWRAAVALAASAVVLTGAMLPAQASTTTGWRVSATIGGPAHPTLLTSVDAVSGRDAWAMGVVLVKNRLQPVIRNWTGKAWTAVTLPAKVARAWTAGVPALRVQIAATSNTNMWAFSALAQGGYLRLSGKQWSIGHLPGARSRNLTEITSAKIFSSHDLWVFGAKLTQAGTTVPYAAHFNGRIWTGVKVPGTGGVLAVSAASAHNLWAIVGPQPGSGAPGTPSVLRWTSSSAGWQPAAVQPKLPAGADLSTILTESNGTVWVGGSGRNGHKGRTELAARWTPSATAWSAARLPARASAAQFSLTQLASDGHGGVWGLGFDPNASLEPNRLWHLTGTTWSPVTPNFGKHPWILYQLAAVPGTRSVWGVGALKEGNSAVGLIALDGVTRR
jgi:hypothetical protein